MNPYGFGTIRLEVRMARHPMQNWSGRLLVVTSFQCGSFTSATDREIIDLVYYHESSIDEVARILNIPKGTVKTRMF